MTKKLKIQGMQCSHCSSRVQKSLQNLSGVTSACVDLSEHTATVDVSSEISDDTLKAAVEALGYEVMEISPDGK